MRKKVIIIGIMIVLVLANITTVFAATDATVSLTASSKEVKRGEQFTVTLSATCAQGINGIDTTYNYDKDKLELVNSNVSNSNDWANFGSENQITVVCNNASQNITKADIYVLTFKVKDNATIGEKATISTNEISLDSNAGENSEIKLDGQQVSITVSETTNGKGETSTGNGSENQNSGGNSSNKPSEGNQGTTGGTTGNQGKTTSNPSKSNSGTKTKSQPSKSNVSTSNSSLPKTGKSIILLAVISIGIVLAIISYRGYKKYRNI